MKNSDSCSCTGNCSCSGCRCNTLRFCWSAVVVAALIGVGLSFLVTLLSLAFGFSVFATTATGPVFSISGCVALLVTAIISMFAVGWIAGYLGRASCRKKQEADLYGLTAWSLTLVLSILLASSSGVFVTNFSHLVNKNNVAPTVSTVTEKIANKIPSLKNDSGTIKNNEVLAATSVVTFFIFFIGALMSGFGARCAFLLSRKQD